uniref:Uncharacterized protein n=1 Tax=Oryza rufipogon TaxID=4529 RepID=A0A0E0P5D4_ORYRU
MRRSGGGGGSGTRRTSIVEERRWDRSIHGGRGIDGRDANLARHGCGRGVGGWEVRRLHFYRRAAVGVTKADPAQHGCGHGDDGQLRAGGATAPPPSLIGGGRDVDGSSAARNFATRNFLNLTCHQRKNNRAGQRQCQAEWPKRRWHRAKRRWGLALVDASALPSPHPPKQR